MISVIHRDESGAPVGNTSEDPYLGTGPTEESTVTPIQIKSVSPGATDAYKPEGCVAMMSTRLNLAFNDVH